MSGRTNILMKAQELGFKLTPDTPETEDHHRADQGTGKPGLRIRGGRSLAGVAHPRIAQAPAELLFTVDTYHVSMRRDGKESICEATVQGARRRRSRPHGGRRRRPGERAGRRLRAALVKFFPQLKKVQLTDYKVRILDGATGTAAKTRVLIAVHATASANGARSA